MKDGTFWGIHMPRELGLTPIKDSFVAIGWDTMGDLSLIQPTREAFKAAYGATYPDENPASIPVAAGVPFRFVAEMKEGDPIIFPSKPDRMINIGVVDGPYEFRPNASFRKPNIRRVRWLKHLPRASFSQAALYEVGSALTLFQVSTNAEEFQAALEGRTPEPDAIDQSTAEQFTAQAQESTQDFVIKRLKSSQTAYQFEHFVAHLLKCMGYYARVTQASGDGGVDIIAHRDELGFEPPIIKVQCKQVLETIGRPAVQQLHGAIEHGEHGLFVTLGSFSPDARTFERTKPNLRLIDGETLIELIYAHYHQFDPRYQVLLPLKQSYIPSAVQSANE